MATKWTRDRMVELQRSGRGVDRGGSQYEHVRRLRDKIRDEMREFGQVMWGGRSARQIQERPTLWADTSDNVIKLWDLDNSEWLSVGILKNGVGHYGATLITAQITLDGTENGEFIICGDAAGQYIVYLPVAASALVGRKYTIKRAGNQRILVARGGGSDTIDGATSVVLSAQYEWVSVVCDGTQWLVVAKEIGL